MVITTPGVFGIEKAPNQRSIGSVQISCCKPSGSNRIESLYMYDFSPNVRSANCSEFQVFSASRNALASVFVTHRVKDQLFEIVRHVTHTWKVVQEPQRPVSFGTGIDLCILLKVPGKLYSIGNDPSAESIAELARGLRMIQPRLATRLVELTNMIEPRQ